MSPTQRSLKHLREQGYTAQVVERWNAWAKVRVDLFSWIDIVAIRHDRTGVLGVQCTSDSNVAARLAKARVTNELGTWLAAGNRLVIHGWGKKGARGARKTWTLREVQVTNPVIAKGDTT